MKLDLIFFLVYPWNFFLREQLLKLRRSLIRFKKNPTKYCKKKLPWNMSIKKIKCNLYAVRLLSPIEPHRCPVYMYFVKF